MAPAGCPESWARPATSGAIRFATAPYELRAALAALYGAASLGFLVWNWPPARIFMGDAGSGFLGFSFGALAVGSFAATGFSLWAWLILLGVFLVDATSFICRRLREYDG